MNAGQKDDKETSLLKGYKKGQDQAPSPDGEIDAGKETRVTKTCSKV
jgi:hypothetical protein